ncbi:MAG: hypothetical protein KGJ57_19375 [Sphingomonadales bacterium]|nr:hypothetical protein [Sphingomonadales bacterium]MDE2171557.1 hypothetical protein [Sphingomonadales bacterium]
MGRSENERWLNGRGQVLAACRAGAQSLTLTPAERLTEIVWLVHRCLRSTGDLLVVRRRDPAYLETASTIALNLGLPRAIEAFTQGEGALETRFFELLDDMCEELRVC